MDNIELFDVIRGSLVNNPSHWIYNKYKKKGYDELYVVHNTTDISLLLCNNKNKVSSINDESIFTKDQNTVLYNICVTNRKEVENNRIMETYNGLLKDWKLTK